MARGIIGTKLGMTQLFDQESGRVTPVTVIVASLTFVVGSLFLKETHGTLIWAEVGGAKPLPTAGD